LPDAWGFVSADRRLAVGDFDFSALTVLIQRGIVHGRVGDVKTEYSRDSVRNAGVAAGIGDIGWHTFRHSYRSWLDETGAPLSVQKELMRHASIQTTMNIYGKAMTDRKRQAHSKVVEMVLAQPSQLAWRFGPK
jgi:integrase